MREMRFRGSGRRISRGLLPTAYCLLFTAGCFEPFDPPSKIADLRILAVRAEPPEARPGEAVRLDALIADPTGAVVPPTLIWLVCFPDPVGGVDACASGVGATPIAFGSAVVDVTVPDGVLPVGDPEATATVLLTLVACTSANPDECLSCDDETGECTFGSEGVETEVALKRVIISNRSDLARNHNPGIAAIEVDAGAGFEPLPEDRPAELDICSGVTLRSRVVSGSAETFTELQFGEPVEITEDLVTSFFATGGAFGADRIFHGVGDGVPPDVADVGLFGAGDGEGVLPLFFVLRDGRGGTDFAARELLLPAACPAE
jgi:hypothetical protein